MHNLNDLIPDNSGLELLSALDINDAGQIVGFGVTPGGHLRGFLLQPRPTGDLNGDGGVNVSDFLLLLAAWGPCPDACCPADLDGDDDVGIGDFLILLGSFD
jgi:hypothetical protein